MFKLFDWDDAFITELPQIDAQHRELVDLINRLGRLCTSLEEIRGADYVATRGALLEYAARHFTEEEAEMRRCDLDQGFQRAHAASHRAFVRRVERLGAPGTEVTLHETWSMLDYLVCWLSEHILVVDQQMARQERAIAAGLSAVEAWAQEQRHAHSCTEPATKALRQLLWKLAESNAKLRTLNHELEQRVAQRTAALSEANRRLTVLSNEDDLTGLPNHRFAVRTLDELWARAREENGAFAILLIDIDRFKMVNDRYGHAVGDALLRDFAARLRRIARAGDTACRLGGDEFLAICPRTDVEQATRLAQRLLRAQQPFSTPDGKCCWDGALSIGIAATSSTTRSAEALLERADHALYRAKQHAGGSFEVADADG